MRFANHAGRMLLLTDDGGVDIASASDGRLPSSPSDVFARWDEVLAWARGYGGAADVDVDEEQIGAPSPRPRQMLGVGLNYASHAAEAGMQLPEQPMVFPKLSAATAGPFDDIVVFTETVDWEVELAVIIGRRARFVAAADAWDHVAGLTVAQDFSDRDIQMRPAGHPQFSLGKSLPGFGPTGPQLVTVDEFEDPANLVLTCTVNGQEVQRGSTNDFVFSVPEVIEYLSATTELFPGDVLMTGTPSGIGASRTPPWFLKPGDLVESRIEGIGEMRHRIVAETPAQAPMAAR